LRAVDGFARLLQEQPSGAEAERYLTLIRKNARTMASLIDGLLKLSQLGRNSLQRQRLDVEALVRQCVDDLLTQRPDQRIEVDLGDLHQCEADDVLFRQIWTNLLSNAAKYSQPRPITRISIGSTRQGDEITYFCRDNGVGFEMRYAEKLFKVFQRLHREEDFEGSGIGLSTVQRIVQRHGGRVWAEAEPDRGATFFFALPARAVRPPVADRSP
jgi:light-regulated signal transduction histidine kinase (bacteriophytochrome)